MWEKFIENGQVDQYKNAGWTIWDWVLEQSLLTLLPIGLFALFLVFKSTRPFAIGTMFFALFIL